MAENVYSFGKLPKNRPVKMMGGYYSTEPRLPTATEQREIRAKRWRFRLATDAGAKHPVRVLLDDGRVFETFTRSQPWQLGNGEWVVLVFGRTGGFLLERVTPL